MAKLTSDMIGTIKAAMLSFVATVNADGTPNLSPKASLIAKDDSLFFANICSPQTISNLLRNPAIAVNVVDIFERRGYRFSGIAAVLSQGDPDFEAIASWVHEVNGEEYPVNHVVKITVSDARPLLSPAYKFGNKPTPEELRKINMKKYGVQKLG
ncbi:pyridoxamine 5'-phosphate oxidase family protein [Acidovorax sp.]|uniref:pyridoxamine 5'-phosphate oxidase family protein n=1 Tax=Acidovorax sp. TaxID=1872122 RepID=UPI00262FE611|nr:pyridoxamine 5'-phosphate oxidase family protein [Acidovorax sp.]